MAKPSIPKGTRDFSSQEIAKRNYITQIIKTNFEKFGFQPIETPSFENSDTLMGKYGEEGDRLIFKILNSGDYLTKVNDYLFNLKGYVDRIFNEEKILEHYKLNFESLFLKSDNIDKKLYYENIELFISKIINSFNSSIIDNEVMSFLNRLKFDVDVLDRLLIIFNNLREFETYKGKQLKSDLERNSRQIINKNLNLYINKVTSTISEKALRYDLTVPFARYVVQHQNELEFPFKRYQMQPVWRADRPQKGRFREFVQCDADVVGSQSLWQEIEFIQLYDTVFSALGLVGTTIKVNNRKILSGIAEVIGAKDKLIDFTVALDKLDKIGVDGVVKEMLEKRISQQAIDKASVLFDFKGGNTDKIVALSELLKDSEEGTKGVEELSFIFETITALGLDKSILTLDVTLARGLNYYTGAIFEVQAPEVALGSVGGGGRYDDLTGIFGSKNNMSGVGISFGLDRIYIVLEELGLFPENVAQASKVLFTNFGQDEALYAFKAIAMLRAKGIKAEFYPDNAKLGKQFQYAEKKGIPFVVVAGEQEVNDQVYNLKNLNSGEQITVNIYELIETLNK